MVALSGVGGASITTRKNGKAQGYSFAKQGPKFRPTGGGTPSRLSRTAANFTVGRSIGGTKLYTKSAPGLPGGVRVKNGKGRSAAVTISARNNSYQRKRK